MKKSTGFLMLLVGLFAGVVGGFLLAPIKKGMCIGSHNGNCYSEKSDDIAECDESEDFEDGISF